MADDLKPHQRLVERPWQSRVRSEMEINDGVAMTALGLAMALKAGRTYHIAAPAKPKAPKPDAKKARRRALVKAARKQKHGGQR